MKNTSLGKILKRYRESCGLTQQQVANALNVDRSTYTYYETGNTTPSVPVIIKLSKIYNVPYTVFMSIFEESAHEGSDTGFRADSFDGRWSVAHDSRYPLGGYVDPYERMLCGPRGDAFEKIYDISGEERQLLALFRVLPPEAKQELLKKAE